MNLKTIFSITLAILLLSALFFTLNKSVLKSANPEEVIFDDGYTASNEEVVFNDSDFIGGDQFFSITGTNNENSEKILEDKSKLSVTFDAYGNKIETRYFTNHPRLERILLRTSADGQKFVFVYGHNGDVKQVTEDMLNRIFTASPDEIANATGIYEGKQERKDFNFLKPRPSEQVQLKPLPSSSFTENPPVEVSPAEETEPETAEQILPTEKRETISSAREPENEQ